MSGTSRRHVVWPALAALAGCADDPPTTPLETAEPVAATSPHQLVPPANGRKIPDHYIVTLTQGADPRAVAAAVGAVPHFVYTAVLNGFAAELKPNQVVRLKQDPKVRSIAQDAVVEDGDATGEEGGVSIQAVQGSAPWGLDRLDQAYLPLNGTYRYSAAGTGVNVYVVSSGIRTGHGEFGGRARAGANGFDAVGDGRNGQDCHGRGTHAAGIVGGATYGVAKRARLYSVRVLDCSGAGAGSALLAGLDWVANRHVKPAVALIDFSVPWNHPDWSPLIQAADGLLWWGITAITGSGNDLYGNNSDCNAPARGYYTIAVGATDASDNWMPSTAADDCTDLFAPGAAITSAWHTSNSATSTQGGTGRAAAHVAGLAALYLQASPTAGPGPLTEAILDNATPGRVSDPSGAPNLLAAKLSGRIAGAGAGENQPWSSSYRAYAGWHHGWLRGPPGANFDLELWQYTTGTGWVRVARKASSSTNEYIAYRATDGLFLWTVRSASGSGEYDLFLIRPPVMQ